MHARGTKSMPAVKLHGMQMIVTVADKLNTAISQSSIALMNLYSSLGNHARRKKCQFNSDHRCESPEVETQGCLECCDWKLCGSSRWSCIWTGKPNQASGVAGPHKFKMAL